MPKYRKLGRTSDVRKALLRSQVTALIANGKIVTTLARAKEVQKIAELKMPDLNAASIEAATSMIEGTAKSMGIVVED